MKKAFFSAASQLAFALAISLMSGTVSAETISFDPGDLGNRLGRSISLTEAFLPRYHGLADMLGGRSKDMFQTASLQAIWYTNYSISTDFGSETGSLGRVYGDVFGARVGKNLSLLFGAGGFRYGVFLTDISLPAPAGDPAGNPFVTDFTGTQFFQDIYAIGLLIRKEVLLTAFVNQNRQYAPNSGVVDIYKPEVSEFIFGGELALGGALSVESFATETGAHLRTEGRIHPTRIVYRAMGMPGKGSFDLSTGIRWINAGDGKFTLSRYTIPTDFSFKPGKRVVLFSGFSVAGKEIREETDSLFRYGYGKAGWNLSDEIQISAGASYIADPRMAYFYQGNTEAIGYCAELQFCYEDLVRFSIGARKNWHQDLADLIETVDRPVFYSSLNLLVPTLF